MGSKIEKRDTSTTILCALRSYPVYSTIARYSHQPDISALCMVIFPSAADATQVAKKLAKFTCNGRAGVTIPCFTCNSKICMVSIKSERLSIANTNTTLSSQDCSQTAWRLRNHVEGDQVQVCAWCDCDFANSRNIGSEDCAFAPSRGHEPECHGDRMCYWPCWTDWNEQEELRVKTGICSWCWDLGGE